MNTDELKNLKIDKLVDARGTACPGPLMATKKRSENEATVRSSRCYLLILVLKEMFPSGQLKRGLNILGIFLKTDISGYT